MAKSSIDRRVARTRAALQQACMSLILKKGHEAVTVGSICKAANVGRSTFYLHYSGKDDIRRQGLENLRKELLTHQKHAAAHAAKGKERLLSFSRPMLEHARAHLGMYRAVVGGQGGTAALAQIHGILTDLVRNELASTAAKSAADGKLDELMAQHIVGAFMGVMTWWLDNGADLSPGQVDEMFQQLAFRGIASMRP